MNLGIELQYTLVAFIGFMLESILYGKHGPTTAFVLDIDHLTLSCRYLLHDIRCIHKNSTQEKT
jgi:hypothetical protein